MPLAVWLADSLTGGITQAEGRGWLSKCLSVAGSGIKMMISLLVPLILTQNMANTVHVPTAGPGDCGVFKLGLGADYATMTCNQSA